MARRTINWSKIDPLIIKMLKEGHNTATIGKKLSIDNKSIKKRCCVLGINFSNQIHRHCLRCGQSFYAETRFLRLCPQCRKSETRTSCSDSF